jgi:copper(I)-binding protein
VHVKAEPVTLAKSRRRIGIGLAVVVALLSAGCAAGQDAQTAGEKPSLDGVNASVGTIDLRGVMLEPPSGTTSFYPSGSDVALKLVIVNNAQQDDQLTSITSPVISGWSSFASAADASAAASAQATAAASGPSTSAGATAVSANQKVSIPANGVVASGTPSATGALLLIGSKTALYPGSSVPLTFTFADAGTITVTVPMGLSTSPPGSVLPAPSTSGIE